MYEEKYFRIIDNKGDGLCLLYSISHFLKKHKNSTGYTLQKGWESFASITNFNSMIESKITEHIVKFVGDLSDEEFKQLKTAICFRTQLLKKIPKSYMQHMPKQKFIFLMTSGYKIF